MKNKKMKLPVTKHEDKRRILSEWIANFPITTTKVIEVKEDSELGNHYHRYKQDFFYLLKGEGRYCIGDETGEFKEGDCITALQNQAHTIFLKAGSILLEASTTPYDKADEISVLE